MTTPRSAQADHEISAFFDRCAAKRLMYAFEPAEQATLRDFVARWELRPGMRVLEPGCGAGRLTSILAEAVGKTGEVLACDLAPQMIALAAERGMPPQARLEVASAAAVNRADAYFDRIICLNVFPHLIDKPAILREFARLLKPEGALWINHFEGREALNRFHHHAAPEVCDHTLPCPWTMRSLMEGNGFELLELTDESKAYWVKAVPAASASR
jgi:ubiquinone/menaquinone biosynthesis C-methylase UbiE